jgi:hypothetical protein
MARAVQQIEQDIAALEHLVGGIGEDLYKAYSEYLAALGETLRRQLILAGYYICTQGYPERFLELTLTQRQSLQQALQKLARQSQKQLIEPLQGSDQIKRSELDPPHTVTDQAAWVVNPPIEEGDRLHSPIEIHPQIEIHAELGIHPEIDIDAVIESATAAAVDANQPVTLIHPNQLKTPKELLKWQEQLEQLSADVLQSVSHAANRLLQQSGVLSKNLPEPILEVAAKAGMTAEPSSGHPNVLNLIVETETEEKGSSSVSHIMAIRLRLSELEFHDPNLTSLRSKIRALSARVSQIKQEYQKRQREKAIAQAEALWRSSWYEGE